MKCLKREDAASGTCLKEFSRQGQYCKDDSWCVDSLKCFQREDAAWGACLENFKNLGNYCESDYWCDDGLKCSLNRECTKFGTQVGDYCEYDEWCTGDGLKCFKNGPFKPACFNPDQYEYEGETCESST